MGTVHSQRTADLRVTSPSFCVLARPPAATPPITPPRTTLAFTVTGQRPCLSSLGLRPARASALRVLRRTVVAVAPFLPTFGLLLHWPQPLRHPVPQPHGLCRRRNHPLSIWPWVEGGKSTPPTTPAAASRPTCAAPPPTLRSSTAGSFSPLPPSRSATRFSAVTRQPEGVRKVATPGRLGFRP